MVGRVDIEGSKNVAVNARLSQASFHCGNFLTPLAENFSDPKDRSFVFARKMKIRQAAPLGPHEISAPIELTLEHLCYHLTDVLPLSNSTLESAQISCQKEATLNPKLT